MEPSAHRPSSWSGWGDPSQVPVLADAVLALLTDGLGISHGGHKAVGLESVALPAVRLSDRDVAALEEIVGSGNALADSESRIRHTRGKSTPDLLRIRAGDAGDAPDLVLLPGSHQDVLDVLRLCSQRRIAVVPFGGGTSVVGGLEPQADRFAGVVALDVRRMDALVSVDEQSRLAQLQPGLRGPAAEALLSARGYTIGHFPQSFEYATLGGFAAARSSGQASAGYGRFDELVLGLRVATPAGELSLGRAPKSAAGPDLRQLFLGSEGALGVITALTVQLSPAPEERLYEGWRFAAFGVGADALRRLAQDGPVPAVLRLSDEAETALNLARPAELGQPGEGGGCLAIIGYEGRREEVARRQAAVAQVLGEFGGRLEPQAGEAWVRDRYRGPYMRDALLDAGALVETLETVGFWSSLSALYGAVSSALRESLSAWGTPPVILCHISHVYRAGASLYFTVGCAAAEDAVGQWRAAKRAVGEAILAAGGSITHHHGIGRDHLEYYRREIGELGIGLLRAVKLEVDPAGILNPGILL